MTTETELEAAALTAAGALTYDDVKSAVSFFIKLFGGHANARDLIAADEAAIQEALDIAEDEKLNAETKP